MAGKVGAGVSSERELHTLVLLRLSASAFYVYQQLSSADKKDYDKIKAALTSAFAVDKFVAFDQFVIHKLHEGESGNVFWLTCDVWLLCLEEYLTLVGVVHLWPAFLAPFVTS
ncbi:hypothetical protein Pmani_004796 [Petrolisthes manimaculis]|uniref:Uncharacterized protein n=1 Tax=Petrolisthes manimaculis TaxID=1843537 RepID=A0AAE1QD11_9EUCA|nr:hypothetical protein Pmani_004796 [Petrolisthes manimaculis]